VVTVTDGEVVVDDVPHIAEAPAVAARMANTIYMERLTRRAEPELLAMLALCNCTQPVANSAHAAAGQHERKRIAPCCHCEHGAYNYANDCDSNMNDALWICHMYRVLGEVLVGFFDTHHTGKLIGFLSKASWTFSRARTLGSLSKLSSHSFSQSAQGFGEVFGVYVTEVWCTDCRHDKAINTQKTKN